MDNNERTILRDDIAAAIRGTRTIVGFELSQRIADAVMVVLCGGRYTITPEGQDYLAAHRRALAGGVCTHGFRVCSECDLALT